MNEGKTDCGPLLERTNDTLGDEALQMLLISTQRTNLELCITSGVKKSFVSLFTLMTHLTYCHCRVLMPYLTRACEGTLRLSEDYMDMQKEIARWFPHTGVRQIILPPGLVISIARKFIDSK
jgi:hypothetical protein